MHGRHEHVIAKVDYFLVHSGDIARWISKLSVDTEVLFLQAAQKWQKARNGSPTLMITQRIRLKLKGLRWMRWTSNSKRSKNSNLSKTRSSSNHQNLIYISIRQRPFCLGKWNLPGNVRVLSTQLNEISPLLRTSLTSNSCVVWTRATTAMALVGALTTFVRTLTLNRSSFWSMVFLFVPTSLGAV